MGSTFWHVGVNDWVKGGRHIGMDRAMQKFLPLFVQSSHLIYQAVQHLNVFGFRQIFATPNFAHPVADSGQIG